MSQELSTDRSENFEETVMRDIIRSTGNSKDLISNTERHVNNNEPETKMNNENSSLEKDLNNSSGNYFGIDKDKPDLQENISDVLREPKPVEEAIVCETSATKVEALPARGARFKEQSHAEKSELASPARSSRMPARSSDTKPDKSSTESSSLSAAARSAPQKTESISLKHDSNETNQNGKDNEQTELPSVLTSVETVRSIEGEKTLQSDKQIEHNETSSPEKSVDDSQKITSTNALEDRLKSDSESVLDTSSKKQAECHEQQTKGPARSSQTIKESPASSDTIIPARQSHSDNVSNNNDNTESNLVHSNNDIVPNCDTIKSEVPLDNTKDTSVLSGDDVSKEKPQDITRDTDVSKEKTPDPVTLKENDVIDECLIDSDTKLEKSDDLVKKITEEEEYMDILGNNLLRKKVLKAGNGVETRPNHGQEVTVKVEGKLANGQIIDKHDAIKFCIGDGDVIQAWEISVCLMEFGEQCELITDAKYAYGTLGLSPDIPENETITYTIELLKVEPAVDINKLCFEERMKIGEEKKERGNFLFQRNDFASAITSYSKALKILSVENLGSTEASKLQEVLESRIKCHNNMAACQLKVEAYDAAIKSCHEVLKSKPQNVKALYRCALACAAKGETGEATKYLKKALQIEPDSKIVNQELAKLTRKLKKENESAKDMYRKMLGTPPPPPPPSDQGLQWWKIVGIGGAVLAVLISVGLATYRNSQH